LPLGKVRSFPLQERWLLVRLTDRCNSSSFFLIGPTRQLKMMFKPIRLIATIIYLGALGMTLFVAIYVR